jgi:hypothetical protein
MLLLRVNVAAALAVLLVCGCLAAAQEATLYKPPFVVHYPIGQESLALVTSDILIDAVPLYEKRLPLGTQDVNVFLFTSTTAFQKFAGGLPTRQVQGFALSEQGIIALKAPELLPPGANYAGIVRHELLHVLIARNTDPDNVPRWFNEGIAMLLSRENRWSNLWSTTQLSLQGRILPLDQLEQAFAAPGSEWEFGAAYEQSLSMTRYLRDRMGKETFWNMVGDLRHRTLADALSARGVSLSDFESVWRADIRRKAIFSAFVSGFTVFQLAAILCVWGYWRYRRRQAKKLAEWEMQEAVDDLFED